MTSGRESYIGTVTPNRNIRPPPIDMNIRGAHNRHMTSRNTTRHFLATTSTGQTFAVEGRNSFGGFANMLARVSAQLGGANHPGNVRTTETAAGEFVHSLRDVDGVTFTLLEVNKL